MSVRIIYSQSIRYIHDTITLLRHTTKIPSLLCLAVWLMNHGIYIQIATKITSLQTRIVNIRYASHRSFYIIPVGTKDVNYTSNRKTSERMVCFTYALPTYLSFDNVNVLQKPITHTTLCILILRTH